MQQISNQLPIIVSGGGIAGLTFSLACQKFGIKTVVIEQSQEYKKNQGQGIGLWGPALMALRSLNIENKLIPKGKNMVCAGYKTEDLQWLVKPSPKIRRLTSCLCIKRHSLQQELFSQLKDKNIIQFGKKIVDFTQDKDSIFVKLDDGTTIQGSLLVGADGVNSIVRNKIFPEILPEYSGYRYYQGIIENQELSNRDAYEAWGANKRFGLVGLHDPLSFWFAAVEKDFGEKPTIRGALPINQEEKRKLQDHFKDFGKETQNVILQTESNKIMNTPIFQLPFMKQWYRDRVVLIGDACHAMAPNLAQGACLSIEDAVDLASSIYKLQYKNIVGNRSYRTDQNPNLSSLGELKQELQLFQKKRQRRAKVVQFLVPHVHNIGRLSGIQRKIRNFIFKISPSFISTPIFDLTHQFALGNYYTSPNLGQGLYIRILGEQLYQNLPLGLQKVMKGDYNTGKLVKGNVNITRDKGLIVDAIHKFFEFPDIIKDGQVKLKIQVDKDGNEHWFRTFSDSQNSYVFNTKQYIEGEQFAESYKMFTFICDLIPHENQKGFNHKINRSYLNLYKSFRIPIPQICNSIVDAQTYGTEKGWKYNIEIKLPGILNMLTSNNLILKYEGEITSVQDI